MGALWLVGGKRRAGKATSSVVLFFDKKIMLESHFKLGKSGSLSRYMTSTGGGRRRARFDDRYCSASFDRILSSDGSGP